MTGHRRLTALETGFLEVERAGAPLPIGSVSILEGAPLRDAHGRFRIDDLRALVASRLALLPQLRSRLHWAPGGLGRPWWDDDPGFDVTRHVDAMPLTGTRDEAALRRLAAAMFATPLPVDRPLWSLRFVTGLPGDRVAAVQLVHHALVDGVSGVDLATMLFDTSPHDEVPVPPADSPVQPGAPAGEPDRELAAAGAEDLAWALDEVGAVAAGVAGAVRHPSAALRRATGVLRGLGTLVGEGPAAPRSSLNAPVGPARELRWVRSRLDGMKAVASAHGVRVNDVALAAVSAGVRDLLIGRGEPLAPSAQVRTLVPVSQRDASQRGTLGNRVAALVVALPIGIGDPVERLRVIGAETARRKASGEVEAGAALVSAADLLPEVALRVAGPLLARQPLVNLVVTNVPGPPFPLYVLGARSLEAFPYVPLAGNLALGVAVLSYDGAINLGITVDPDSCPDAGVFAAGVERGLGELGVGGPVTGSLDATATSVSAG